MSSIIITETDAMPAMTAEHLALATKAEEVVGHLIRLFVVHNIHCMQVCTAEPYSFLRVLL
jgi:hypothetical protein